MRVFSLQAGQHDVIEQLYRVSFVRFVFHVSACFICVGPSVNVWYMHNMIPLD